MFEQGLVVVVTLMTAGVWLSPQVTAMVPTQRHSNWQRVESQHFEIHYLPVLERELERVTRSAERAYARISGRLNFTLRTKVPLVIFAPPDALTREQVVTYATSDAVAPQQPHRSRIVLPVAEDDAKLDGSIVHELSHLLMCEVILPGRGGDGGVPRWVHEGFANYMVGGWPDEDERLMRELVEADRVPALSQLTGRGEFSNPGVNDALGHAAFDYIETRWGATGLRRFLDALIVPRVDKTYDAVFELTPEEFDAAFRQYAERRFTPALR
jgi:hypothetical protein